MILRPKEKIIYITKDCEVSTNKRNPFELLKYCIYKYGNCNTCDTEGYCTNITYHRRYNRKNHNNVIVFFNEITVL